METQGGYARAQEARQAVADAGRLLLAEGLVARTWGNVSCRTAAEDFMITPSGLGYDAMTAADVVPYHMADDTFEGARKPSSEKGVHAAAYRRFPDARFVIHTHQCYASALGLAGFDRLKLSEADEAALGGVALAKYALPGTGKLSAHVAAALDTGAHCVLMAHHGALIAGRDPEEAFGRAKRLEAVCRAACRGLPAGTEEADEEPDIERLDALTRRARERFGQAAFTAAPAVIEASRYGPLPAQLDDSAQMIGARLPAVEPEEAALLKALRRHDAVLVRGLGAVCRAGSAEDLVALCKLIQKACVSALHTRACGVSGRLSFVDTALMRMIYVTKYAKKIGG